MNTKIKKAIFPVAGLGTRFLPATKSVPKEMLNVLDRPILEWSVIEAFKSGIEQIIFVSSAKKHILLEHFDRSKLLEDTLLKKKKKKELELIKTQYQMGDIITIFQPEPKGLGHAIWCARNLVQNEKFAVVLPDDIIKSEDPVLKQLIGTEEQIGGSVVAVERVPKSETFKYGIIDYFKKNKNVYYVRDVVEKPEPNLAPSNLSVIGRYLLDSKIFDFLEKQKVGVGGEIQLTDAIQNLIKDGNVFGLEFDGIRYDCGSKLGFIKANIGFGLSDKDIKKDLLRYLKKL